MISEAKTRHKTYTTFHSENAFFDLLCAGLTMHMNFQDHCDNLRLVTKALLINYLYYKIEIRYFIIENAN